MNSSVQAKMEAQGRIEQALRAVVLGDERVLQNLFKKYVGEELDSVDESEGIAKTG